MNWIEFIGVVVTGGLAGAIVTKLLDIFWLQKKIEEREKKGWLRDRRLRVFSKLSREFMSFRLYKNTNTFKLRGIASESIILIEEEDVDLVRRIEEFIARLDALYTGRVGNEKEQEKEYNKLYIESREIVNALRDILIKKEVKNDNI
ncbi:hypothetical protein ES702_02843 [subsurface metagenome]